MKVRPKIDSVAVVHNNLIEALAELDVTQTKIIILVIGEIKEDQEELLPLEYSITDIANIVGNKKSETRYKYVRNALQTLQKDSVVALKGLDQDGDDTVIIGPYFSSVEITPAKNRVIFEISKKMKPYILLLKKHFTKIEVRYSSLFGVDTHLNLYIYLVSVSYKREETISIEDLRAKLGMKEGKMASYSDFRRFVLDLAKKDIMRKTNIGFEYEPIKRGRGVGYIKFRIFKNTPEVSLEWPSDKEETDKERGGLVAKAVKYGLSEKVALQEMEGRTDAEVEEALRVVDQKLHAGEADNLIGLVRSALRDGYKDDAGRAKELKKEKEKEAKKKKNEAIEKEEDDYNEQIEADNLTREEGKRIFFSLDKKGRKKKLEAVFERLITTPTIKDRLLQAVDYGGIEKEMLFGTVMFQVAKLEEENGKFSA